MNEALLYIMVRCMRYTALIVEFENFTRQVSLIDSDFVIHFNQPRFWTNLLSFDRSILSFTILHIVRVAGVKCIFLFFWTSFDRSAGRGWDSFSFWGKLAIRCCCKRRV